VSSMPPFSVASVHDHVHCPATSDLSPRGGFTMSTTALATVPAAGRRLRDQLREKASKRAGCHARQGREEHRVLLGERTSTPSKGVPLCRRCVCKTCKAQCNPFSSEWWVVSGGRSLMVGLGARLHAHRVSWRVTP
jgi:hypothetical protein